MDPVDLNPQFFFAFKYSYIRVHNNLAICFIKMLFHEKKFYFSFSTKFKDQGPSFRCLLLLNLNCILYGIIP